MPRWIIRDTDANIDLMAKTLKINPILCKILANRGVRSKHAAIRFLNPLPGYMHDTAAMAGVECAAGLVFDAIRNGKTFCIFGDYDVDGITATLILYKALIALGGTSGYYIPHREQEGYGLNIPAIENISKTTDVLITVDNGIAAIDEVARAKELGMTVIIIDHHQPPYHLDNNGEVVEELPAADAIIDPKQANCTYSFKEMCAAAIAYKFSEYLHKKAEKPYKNREEAVIFAAIASFCDVVDLVDENRIIAATGLALLNKKSPPPANIGLNALVRARKLEYNKIGAFDIGFIIGPCINATGRLESAMLGVELFMCEDDAKAMALADKLVQLNDERKDMCAKFVEKVVDSLQGTDLDKVLVLYEPEIHESIAGIVAGRVKDALHRPTIVLAQSGGIVKGSARSIERYNIFEEMQKCKDLFLRFGGHKMAAGVSLAEENVNELRRRLNAACVLSDDDFIPNIYIDKELRLDDVTYELADSLNLLAPFGKENKQPLFATYDVYTESVEIIGQSGETMRLCFRLASGRKLRAVAFKSVDKFAQMLAEDYSDEVVQNFLHGRIRNTTVKMDIAYHIEINEFNGNSSLQLRVVDIRLKT